MAHDRFRGGVMISRKIEEWNLQDVKAAERTKRLGDGSERNFLAFPSELSPDSLVRPVEPEQPEPTRFSIFGTWWGET